MLYCNRPYFGHAPESVRAEITGDPWNDPDYVFRDLELLSEMLEETEQILEEYRSRLAEQILQVIAIILLYFVI